jgi:hypothetical protein
VRRAAARNLVLSLGAIDTSHIWEHRGVTPERCARILADALAVPPLDPSRACASGTACLRVDLAITAMHAGKVWLPRFVASLVALELPGARAAETASEDDEKAWLQVEGTVSELGKARPALSFAHRLDRELSFGRSGHVLKGAHAIAEASIAQIAGDMAYDILREIGAAFTK